MTIIYILIPLSLVLLALAVWAFFWAVKNDQFEDLDTPAMDILDDDDGSRHDVDRDPPARPAAQGGGQRRTGHSSD